MGMQIQGGSVPAKLTTKGDIIGFSTDYARIAVGATDGLVLTVDAASTPGIKWATVSSGWTRVSTTTLGGAGTFSLTSIPNKKVTKIICSLVDVPNSAVIVRFNNDSGANQYRFNNHGTATSSSEITAIPAGGADIEGGFEMTIVNIASYQKNYMMHGGLGEANATWQAGGGRWLDTTAINRIDVLLAAGNFGAGSTIELWQSDD